MKFNKILLLGYSGNELEEEYWKRIDAICAERVIVSLDDSSLQENLKGADCLLVKLGAKVGQNLIEKATDLKYIGMLGTGVGGIDIDYAASRGIAVCNIADYATEGVAEFTFGVILDKLRELERAKQQARENNYSESTFTGTEIKGKNFGVIGLGNIGKRIARIAEGFGAKVSYWSKNKKQGFNFQEIDSLLKNSDIITVNLSLVPETNGFLNEERIKMIKKGALVVNSSPMELIDLDALVARLGQGDISFILDHSDEMTGEQLAKLKPFKNCIIYPPIAYTTNEATELKKGIFVGNLENFLNNSPSNKVN
ncbi:MAG: Phosphoglycerate dehydrogenase [Candidatus Pacebacteria bacterium GW2011_GWF2_38_9]|nr:MAG: phosphoglycerate dehydrogenase, D-3-phosphoglycerate dehydrogenase [candidate division TM6 bacterium GW2011_GWF2_28_16]KKQ09457.1 MAG: Phosphoglycerate dehydrogenase [Candidatus Pacebacteria bacterium GW2011_GWF1_36_5]KKQ89204.1 MAG: Phosphoglycerate dehydrogenase [Candidatus Pacebacteria bacterium GW2011_GWF2_38_9]HAZ73775.1 hypothetical protein [Candidatus Paceibacterota bacterium]